MVFLCICIVYFRYVFREICYFFFNIQVLSTSVTCHEMVFLCICIVYVRYVFREICFFSTYRSCLHPLHVMRWFSYVFALYTFVKLLKDVSDFLDSSQLYVLVYIHYTYLGGFLINFYCTRLSLLKDISFFYKFDHKVSCLHLTISLLCLPSCTLLRCIKMRPAGNLLSFCALYVD